MFKSNNYARVVCSRCNSVTTILPGATFSKLECTCSTDKSKPCQEIKLYTDGNKTVEVLGEFKNGDFEVRYQDGVLNYRIPKKTFIQDFEEVKHDIPPQDKIVAADEFFEELEYDSLTVPQLKAIAKEMGLEGIAKLTKDKLIKRIENGKD